MWPKNPETVSLKIQRESQPEVMDGQGAITGQVLQIDENYLAHHSHLHLYYTVVGRDNIILKKKTFLCLFILSFMCQAQGNLLDSATVWNGYVFSNTKKVTSSPGDYNDTPLWNPWTP